MLLLEMVVRTADEGMSVLELAVEIFPFLHMLDLDVHGKVFSHQLELVPEAFHKHTGVSFDFLKPVIHLRETLIVTVKPLLNAVEALSNLIEAFIKVLNEFLVHGASAG